MITRKTKPNFNKYSRGRGNHAVHNLEKEGWMKQKSKVDALHLH